jgi:phage terminase large subunit
MARIRNVDLRDLKKITNEIFYNLYKNKDRYLILYGGAGSGKSVYAAQKIIYRIITEQKHRILVIRKVARTLRHSVFSLIKETISQYGLLKYAKINKSDMVISIHAFRSEIIFVGLDDPEKIKSISGITSIWIEEATELNQNDFNQIDLRLRGRTKDYKQVMMSFNPVSALHWLKARFFDAVVENTTVLKTTYKNNQFIDEEYKNTLENLKTVDKYYYEVYALGEWGLLGNIIFTNWQVKKIKFKIEDFDSVYYGLDFGYNDPSAYVQVGFKDDEMYIINEIYEKGLTNLEMINLIKKIHPTREVIIADSSRPDLIKECNQKKLKMIASKKGKDSIVDGIDYIKRFKIYIDTRCINATNEFQSYKWAEDKDGNILDKPVDVNNHLIDAIRYSLEMKRIRFKFTEIGADGIMKKKDIILNDVRRTRNG